MGLKGQELSGVILSKRWTFPMECSSIPALPQRKGQAFVLLRPSLTFFCFFCLFQGDPGIQGYPGRKVRRGAPILLNELRCTDALQDQVCKSVDFSGALC